MGSGSSTACLPSVPMLAIIAISTQATETHDLLWAAIIPACLAFVAAVTTAVIAWLGHRTSRAINEQVHPENGGRLGELVEQVAKTGDATNALAVVNAKRTDRVETKVDELGAVAAKNSGLIAEGNERAEMIEAKLDGHIEDTAPLVERAKAEWGDDGTKKEAP